MRLWVRPSARSVSTSLYESGPGSTTMHQAHSHLASVLDVPVVNPGPLSYKLVETLLALGLAHSRTAYPRPQQPKPAMVTAMFDAAAEQQRVGNSGGADG